MIEAKTACLPPTVTVIWSMGQRRPFSRSSFSEMARRSSGIPLPTVYLVKPSAIALMPATLM